MLKLTLRVVVLSVLLAAMPACGPYREAEQATAQHALVPVQVQNEYVESRFVSERLPYQLAKASYTSGSIRIDYPQITSGFGQAQKQAINDWIRREALKVLLYYPDTEGLSLQIEYTIPLQQENVLSIQYAGLGNVAGTAHPNHLFYTTTLQLEPVKQIRLPDIVNIDEAFVELLRNAKPLHPVQASVLTDLTNEELLQQLANADSLDAIGTEHQSDAFSYLTPDSLGISIGGIGFALGDHAEFEIRLQDIPVSSRKDHDLWKSLYRDGQ